MLDPLLEQTVQTARPSATERRNLQRTPTRLERWAWSEVPAYRLGLFLGYAGTIYFGVSAFIAGVPAFTVAAPEGWTPIWASLLVIGGIVGLLGSIRDSQLFHRVELAGAFLLSATLTTFAGTVLFIAYQGGDNDRVAAGAGFVGLAVPPVIRMLWLIANVITDIKTRRAARVAVAAAIDGQ